MAYKNSDIPPELRRSQDIMSGELLSEGAQYNKKGEMGVTERQ
ncbi:MAG: hypothetical protein P4L74_04845 [Candidatus Doudnabacteria bacterium]|nr:hypothetical protein [Candidatus Doudnabacteria bacterium]